MGENERDEKSKLLTCVCVSSFQVREERRGRYWDIRSWGVGVVRESGVCGQRTQRNRLTQ